MVRGSPRAPRAALRLPATASAAARDPQAGAVVVTCQGAWEELGTAARVGQERLAQTNREASEMRDESMFDVVH